MYRQRLHYFEYEFTEDRDRLMAEFERFIGINIPEFFSSAEELGVRIKVPYSMAKSVTNKQGKSVETLKSLSNLIGMESMNRPNKDGGQYDMKPYHQQVIFDTILKKSTSFQKMINLIDEYVANATKSGYEWNVVYYDYYQDSARSVLWVN